MRLLLDQGLGRVAAELLRHAGHDAVHIGELGLPRARDEQIVEIALREGRTIATFDGDFHAMLAVSNASGPSVIRLRVQGADAAARHRWWRTLLTASGPSWSTAASWWLMASASGVGCFR